MNEKPTVTSVHLMLFPQQGMYSVFVKVMLAGDSTPFTFETPPNKNPRVAYFDAFNMVRDFIDNNWHVMQEIVAEHSPAPSAQKPSRPAPSAA